MASPFRKDESRTAEAVSYNAYRPLTAAASRMNLSSKTEADQFKLRRSSDIAKQQTEAWLYYDAIGEIKFAFNLVANIVSRIRLYAAVVENPAETPIEADKAQSIDPFLGDEAQRLVSRLDSAFGGQPGLLRDAALNLLVSGECYLVNVPERPSMNLPESWDIRSTSELLVDQQGNYTIYPRRDLASGNAKNSDEIIRLGNRDSAFAARIWRPHPQYSNDPDSSMIGVLDMCAELLLLNKTFRGIERSRLNAGLLYIPDGLSTAANGDPDLYADDDSDEPTPEEEADSFEENLIDAMTTPIEDESSASAVVPLLVRGPVELGKEIRHIQFERPWDDTMSKRAKDVLDRILQGLDVPKDSITGLANVKYSNAIQIDESLYKAHIEPLILLLVDAITVVYLRPMLREAGWDEADIQRVTVWYDPSSVATRNDRAADADAGYDKKLISGEAWRNSRGFSESDAPTPNEIALRMLIESGSMTPEFYENLFRVIAPDVAEAVRAAQQASSPAPITPDIANALAGQPGAPTDPNAPVDEAGAASAAEPGAEAAPGEDGPPIPLAEPE